MHINYGVLPPDPPFSGYFKTIQDFYNVFEAGLQSDNVIKGTTFAELAANLNAKYPDISEADIRSGVSSPAGAVSWTTGGYFKIGFCGF